MNICGKGETIIYYIRGIYRMETLKKVKSKIIIVAVLIIVMAISIGVYNTPSNRINRHLNLGQKYLEEHDYEQAIVEFDKVIAIDPMSVDAYLGKAQAYESMGNKGKAIEVLQAGYEITNDLRLKDYIDKLSTKEEDLVQVTEKADNHNEERAEEIRQFLDEELDYNKGDILWMCRGYVNPYQWGYYGEFLSDEQIEEICSPLANAMEEYIEITEDEGIDKYGCYLAWFYYVLGKYDKCLQMRKQVYELTGNNDYKPEEYTEEYVEVGVSFTYDKYGNIITHVTNMRQNPPAADTYYYDSNGRLSKVESNSTSTEGKEMKGLTTYQYDTGGRLVEETFSQTHGDKWWTEERKYQYEGNKMIVYYHDEDSVFGVSDSHYEYEIDRYGKKKELGEYSEGN